MNRAVIDTNVVVSGFLSPSGAPGRIVEWLRNGSIRAVLDDRIAAEYLEVLARPLFALPVAEVRLVLGVIRARGWWVEAGPEHRVTGLPDPDDAPSLECARAAGVPLVTGSLRHYPKATARSVTVLTPAQYVTRRCPPPEG